MIISSDTTIRFEIGYTQPESCNKKKSDIYNKTLNYYYKLQYEIRNIEVIRPFIGSKGTITTFLVNFWENKISVVNY